MKSEDLRTSIKEIMIKGSVKVMIPDSEKTFKELLEERHRVIQTLTLAINMRDITAAQIFDKRLNALNELLRNKGAEINDGNDENQQ